MEKIIFRKNHVIVKGEKILIKKYLKGFAKKLPPLIDKQSKKMFNHYENLIFHYKTEGVKGINEYIDFCESTFNKFEIKNNKWNLIKWLKYLIKLLRH